MNLIYHLESILEEKKKVLNADNFKITGVWGIEMAFLPSDSDYSYLDFCLLIQTNSGTGFCTCLDNNFSIDKSIIGRDFRKLTLDRQSKIACIDSVFSRLTGRANYEKVLLGPPQRKAMGRAEIIYSEIMFLGKKLKKLKNKNLTVHMIGSVGSIIKKLRENDIDVFATDLDKSILGFHLGGVEIKNGLENNKEYIERSDICLISGMTLVTGTLGEILNLCKNSNTQPMLYAQTGYNLASEYLNIGVKVVIAESFPNYIFPGDTHIKVYKLDD